MVVTQQVSLTEALDIERFKELAPKLADLSDPDSFQEKTESDLWQIITGDASYSDGSIEYGDLPDRSKALIGYTAEGEIPWWLHSFSWSATSHGETISLDSEDELAKFEDFDPQHTTIHKPQLQANTEDDEEEIVMVLEAFEDLYEALPDDVRTETEVSETDLPGQVFEIEEGVIRTTEAFEEWLHTLLQLSPPLNDQLTALLMADVGLEREALQQIMSQTLLDRLDEVGLGKDRISNGDYREHLRKIMALNGVFDLEVPQTSEYDELGGLEGLFYQTWAQSFTGDAESAAEWIEKAHDQPDDLETGMQGAFAESVFDLPVQLDRGMISYATLRVTKSHLRYYSSEFGKRDEIDEIMRMNGFLE